MVKLRDFVKLPEKKVTPPKEAIYDQDYDYAMGFNTAIDLIGEIEVPPQGVGVDEYEIRRILLDVAANETPPSIKPKTREIMISIMDEQAQAIHEHLTASKKGE